MADINQDYFYRILEDTDMQGLQKQVNDAIKHFRMTPVGGVIIDRRKQPHNVYQGHIDTYYLQAVYRPMY